MNEWQPKVVLAVGAHPDDVEVTAGGSIARWVKNGAEVQYAICTDGSKGSSDRSKNAQELIENRHQETKAAAESLGVKNVHFLDFEDGHLESTRELKRELVRLIRTVKPDTVVCMDPTMVYSLTPQYVNHTDHRAAGQAVFDAVFPLARDHLSFVELHRDEQLEPHKVQHLLMTNFDKHNFYVDIADTFEAKMTALAKHQSQFADLKGLEDWLRSQAVTFGKDYNVELAEAFVKLDLPG